jgi:hypothetical protein
MFIKPPKPRKFTYRPKYYRPEEIEDEEAPRIKFRRHKLTKYTKKRSILVMVVIVIILISLLKYWLTIESVDRKEFKFDNLKIEEIR